MSSVDTIHHIDSDFRRSLRRGLGWLGVVMLSVIAAIRFRVGQVEAGAIDVGWAVAMLAALGWIRWRRNSMGVGAFMAVASILSCMAKIHVLQLDGVPWLFPVTLGAFAVTTRVPAAVAAGAGVAFASWTLARSASLEIALAMSVSLVLTLLVAFVTTSHVEMLRERLKHLAVRDALTGAENRRALESALRLLLDRPRRPAAVAMMDIDHFKRINDEHGHSVGDRILGEFADLVRMLMRPQDRFFRYGGEEFVLLMPDAGREEALGLVRLVNAAVRQKIRTRGGPVTVSVGMAMSQPGDTRERLLSRADVALYAAKDAGRDRVFDDTGPGAARAT